ncbi:HAMP domain-containing protein [Shewanella sp. VB17]|uniref:ATP-binding protein n=1 Tax=Shewanella sp. VB17 TaxID=2739432 RepID=UPI0015678A86|nr:ATP-binding protein [Shewanella sp. VB17]NRD75694.1 HAMP domain-containing protein [Shewanella sp. VB17]
MASIISPKKIPNRIFIKLLLSFWLCSSVIITAVGLLPLLQQNHDRGPLPPHLKDLLVRFGSRISDSPELLNTHNLKHLTHRRDFKGKPIIIYIVNDQGLVLNKDNISRGMRRFMLMAEEANQPISHQFKNELLFGPYNFEAAGKQYSLYGRFADHHRRPWFFFLAENKLLTLSLAITLSGLLCGLLAWHLGKPLRTLKLSADALANGDLTSRVDKATIKRKDEIGQLAQAFNSMADSVENMLNNQQRLISDISHELRTPLTRLQLALALSRKKGHESTEIDRIGYEAEQLEQMIAELLELSKVKLNVNESKRHLGLAETLGQVLDDAEFEAEQQQKKLTINIDEEIELPHYPRPLSRAIENLLRNAIRYSSTGVSIEAIETTHKVSINIIDDGPGIEHDHDLKAIFKPFYRPQSARERESGGWGLGLAIAEAAVLAHKGSITAKNRTPHGLHICITLPKK